MLMQVELNHQPIANLDRVFLSKSDSSEIKLSHKVGLSWEIIAEKTTTQN